MRTIIPFADDRNKEYGVWVGPAPKIEIKNEELRKLVYSASQSKERYFEVKEDLEKRIERLEEKENLVEFIEELNELGTASVVLGQIGERFAESYPLDF